MSAPIMLPPVQSSPVVLTGALAAASAAASELPTAIVDGAAALAALSAAAGAVSSSFTGTVAAGSDPGALVLLTSFGNFAIASASPLPLAATLTLQLLQSGQPGAVAILAVNDVPTAPAVAASAPPATPEAPPTPPTLLDLGARLIATVIAAAAPSAAAEPLPTQAPSPAPPLAVTADATSPSAVPLAPAPAATAPLQAQLAAPAPQAALANNLAAAPADASQPSPGAVPVAAAPVIAASGGAPGIIAAPDAREPALRVAPILPPAPSAAWSPGRDDAAGAPAASAGDRLPGRAAASAGPEPAATAAPSGPTRAASASAAGPLAATRALPAGTSLALRVVALQAAAAPGSPQALSPPALTGIIRSVGSAGAVIETPSGALRLVPAPALPDGTRVAIRLVPGEPASARIAVVADHAPVPAAAPTPGGARAPQRRDPGQPPDQASPVPTAVAASPAAPAAAATARAAVEQLLFRVFVAPGGAAAAPQATPANTVVGTVLADHARAPSSASLVETPLGVLAVSPRLAAPAGTLLLLELPDIDASLALAAPDPAAPGRLGDIARHWPTLAATLVTLDHAAPSLAAELRADFTTQGGDKLAGAFLYLVAALRSGGPAWPGAAVEHALALAGSNDLAKRLTEDVGELRRIAAAPATAPWQVFVLPLLDGPALRPIRLYLKRRGEGGSGRRGDGEDKARFILEFEMSRLGTMQLDGFIRQRRFDLALRSHAPLAPALRAEVRRIFHDRIAAAGFTGEIDFAAVARFDVAPLDALRQHVGLAV